MFAGLILGVLLPLAVDDRKEFAGKIRPMLERY